MTHTLIPHVPDVPHRPHASSTKPPPRRLFGARISLGAIAVSVVMLAAPNASAQPNVATPTATAPAAAALRAVPVVGGLEHPWSLAFLPDGRALITERGGRLRVVNGLKSGAVATLSAPVAGLPPVVANGQGGLLDVAVDPKFAQADGARRFIYWSYAESSEGLPAAQAEGSGQSTAVARGRWVDDDQGGGRLTDVQVIFRQRPKVDSRLHFGSRLVFDGEGLLYITLGDRYSRMRDAQTLDTHHGKIVRIHPDGRVPADNPFVSDPKARPEIWSYGHRNVQGAALHPTTGALWAHEHGPQGGDELNLVRRGGNHGWPTITHGRNYGTGTTIGEGTERADVVPARRTWIPSIAPSGMAFVTSDRLPGMKGDLFIGALAGQRLVRVVLKGDVVEREESPLPTLKARIRDVRQGPDGWLYVLTDASAGQLLRIEPAAP